MTRAAFLALFGLALLLSFPAVAQTTTKKVAVLEIEDSSKSFDPSLLSNATEMLRGRLSATGRFVVIDKSRQAEMLRKLVKESKQESWKECYDNSCRIQLGQALSADTMLRSTISCIGEECQLSCELVDLAKEATIHGAAAEFDKKDTKGLLEAIRVVVGSLGGEPSARPYAAASAPGTGGTLSFKTSPAGVEVVLDPDTSAERTCISPCSFEQVPLGDHYVDFRKSPYKTGGYAIRVEGGVRRIEENFQIDAVKAPQAAIDMALQGDYDGVRDLLSQNALIINTRRGNLTLFWILLDKAPQETLRSLFAVAAKNSSIARGAYCTLDVYQKALEKGYSDLARQCCYLFPNAGEVAKRTPAGQEATGAYCTEQIEKRTTTTKNIQNYFLMAGLTTPLVGTEIDVYRAAISKHFLLGAFTFRLGLDVPGNVYGGVSTLWIGGRYLWGEKKNYEIGIISSISPFFSGTSYFSHLYESQVYNGYEYITYNTAVTRASWFYTRAFFAYHFDSFFLEAGVAFPLLWYQTTIANKDAVGEYSSNYVTKTKMDGQIALDILLPFDLTGGASSTGSTKTTYSYYCKALPPMFFYFGIGL